jgi:hypothetical protein
MTEEELLEGARKVAKEFYSLDRIIARSAKIVTISKIISSFVPIGLNFAYRRQYLRDLNF